MNWEAPPLFLIGAARSGTTLLGELIGGHPDLAYWIEPRYVWRYGDPGRSDDCRPAADATPKVARHIRRCFERYTHKRGRPRFMEKTPSNCFRVAFMHRIFPDAYFVHLLRDGRDVAASALNRWRSPPDDRAIWRRIRNWEISLRDIPHYLPDISRELLLRRFSRRRAVIWGPRFPGLPEMAASGVPAAVLCARQWRESTRFATAELADVPERQVLTLRYEDLVRHPAEVLRSVFGFAGLACDSELLHRAVAQVHADRGSAFQNLSAEERDMIERECVAQ